MNDQTQHTPTPFVLQLLEERHGGYDGWETFTLRDGKTNGCLAVIGAVDRQFDTVNRANANFILTACNNFAEMQRSLVEAESALFYATTEGEFDTEATAMQVSSALEIVRTMLHKLHNDEQQQSRVIIKGGESVQS